MDGQQSNAGYNKGSTNPKQLLKLIDKKIFSTLCSIFGLFGPIIKKKYLYTVKPVLSRHSKIDKTKILMINSSLM